MDRASGPPRDSRFATGSLPLVALLLPVSSVRRLVAVRGSGVDAGPCSAAVAGDPADADAPLS